MSRPGSKLFDYILRHYDTGDVVGLFIEGYPALVKFQIESAITDSQLLTGFMWPTDKQGVFRASAILGLVELDTEDEE